MSKRKKQKRTHAEADRTSEPLPNPESLPLTDTPLATGQVVADDETESAGTKFKVVASLVIVVHFFALLVALSANLFPSALQEKFTLGLSGYLVSTSQNYGSLPLELTHSEPFDYPLIVQVRRKKDGKWKTAEFAGYKEGDYSFSRWMNMARLVRLAVEENSENEILGEIGFGLSRHIDGENPRDAIDAIRLVQPIVLNFDQATATPEEQRDILGLAPKTVFQAAVIRRDGEIVGVVPAQESYRSSKAQVSGESEANGNLDRAPAEMTEAAQ